MERFFQAFPCRCSTFGSSAHISGQKLLSFRVIYHLLGRFVVIWLIVRRNCSQRRIFVQSFSQITILSGVLVVPLLLPLGPPGARCRSGKLDFGDPSQRSPVSRESKWLLPGNRCIVRSTTIR